ncbi:hypothetical protein FACS1894190_15350 [Spirochaetia bacterium]|nr:hypothetical protein FACS1894190_15350 [Spirochaetia bacterium]
MKRKNYLFEKIADYQNIRTAFLKAIRGKRSSGEVLIFCRNVEAGLENLRNRLFSQNIRWGAYRSFTITDPKLRTISAAPIEDRIMHHAIMNILEPLFERQMIYHTYACRKNKGAHAAVLYAFKNGKSNNLFLKLDVRKYFDSIDHAVLKQKLNRIIKDVCVLNLLFGIIDSYHNDTGRGLPIGNLTSQFFANLYLSGMDHYINEQQKPAAYVRYMDDFILWAGVKKELKGMYKKIENYTENELNLKLKQPVIGKTEHGLPFLGFMIKKAGIYCPCFGLIPRSSAAIFGVKQKHTYNYFLYNDSFLKKS